MTREHAGAAPRVAVCRLAVAVAVASAVVASACSSDQAMTVDLVPAGSSSTSSAVGTSTLPETTTTTKPAPPDVHAVDFQAATLPAESCKVEDYLNSQPIPLVGGVGSSGSRDDLSYAEATLGTGPPQFVDLDGDGFDEAVLLVSCSWGGDGRTNVVLPLTTSGGTLGMLGGHNISASSIVDRTPTLGEVDTVTLDGTTVVVVERVAVDGEGLCCMTGRQTVRWTFANGAWSHAIDAPPAPTGLQLDGLTTDGIEPLHFGDPLSKAEQLTGRTAEVCTGLGDGSGALIDDALPGVILSFDDGVFVLYSVRTADASTPKGGRVGLTVDALKEVIPYVEYTEIYERPAYVVRSEGNSIVFWVDDNVVTSMTVGKSGRVEDVGELC